MKEIDVAVFTFDSEDSLRLVNRAGEQLLVRPAERLLGRTAADLGLEDCLEGEPSQTLDIHFPGGSGRWGVRRTSFRDHGLPHQLLVISDLSRPLREEERLAWQRLIRVLGHELNNSLTPIKFHCRDAGEPSGQRIPSPGLEKRRAAGSKGHNFPRGSAQPFHGSLLSTGSSAPAQAGTA